MSVTTPSMGLVVWESLTDNYSNTQLSANFVAIDSHNHTPGAGVQLGTGSLVNDAITWPLINPGAVQGSAGPNGANIYAGSITSNELAANSVTATQLSAGAVSSAIPIGSIVPWFRPNTGVSVPTNWHVCDGTTLTNGQHNFPGGGSVTLPNLINSMVLGCTPGGTGNNGPNVAPGENVVGGSNSQNLSHTHTIPAHNHDLSNHTHTVGSHAHSISFDGNHNHTFNGGYDIHTRPNTPITGLAFNDVSDTFRNFNLDSAYVGAYVFSDTDQPMDNNGTHNHSGSTGGSGVLSSGGPSVNATSTVNLDSEGPDTSLPSDFRMNFVGLIMIIKIQ